MTTKNKAPKVLLVDIETAPIISYTWGIWEQNVGLNQIKKDWHLLSWSAKWLGDPASKIMYMDQRKAKNVEDDTGILMGIWKLLDQCDIVITQNGKAFDVKKLNARFILKGMGPPSSFKHIDTKILAKRHFAFTSNSLEYLSGALCKKFKKLKHPTFSGFEMWKECLKGNLKAWKEMEKYNKYDVLALEELYTTLAPWDNSVKFDLYNDAPVSVCNCGANSWKCNGFKYTASGKYQRYKCNDCGTEARSRTNLFTKAKRQSMKA